MKRWSLFFSSVRRTSAIAAVAGSILLAQSHSALAEDVCTATGSCGDTSALAEDLMQRRLNRTLAVSPTDDRFNRLNTPGTSAAVPFAITPDGDNTNFKFSLGQLRSSLSAADEKRLKAASETSGEKLPVPKLVKPPAQKLDVWAAGRREAFTESGDVTKEGNAVTTFMGADYRVGKDLLLGGMVQLDEARQSVLSSPEGADGTAYMAGPYVAYQLTPHLQVDAKTAWGTGQNSATAGSESTAFDSQRMLSEAKVSGQWGWQGWQLSQSGAVTYLDETSAGIAGVPGTSVDMTRLSVGPEVKRRFERGDTSIEPFAFFKSSVDLSEATLADPNALNTIGGGVTLAKPDHYSVRATANFSESTGSADPGVAQGKVSVSVPTSILGF